MILQSLHMLGSSADFLISRNLFVLTQLRIRQTYFHHPKVTQLCLDTGIPKPKMGRKLEIHPYLDKVESLILGRREYKN
jgi:hypothetical protein